MQVAFREIKASVARFFSPIETKSASTTVDAWGLGDFILPNTGAGIAVTPRTAMRVPTVAACALLIAKQSEAMPAKLYRRVDDAKEAATDHPAFRLVHRSANDHQSAGQLRFILAMDAMLHGNGYAVANRLGDGRVLEFNYVPATALSVALNDLGEPVYTITTKSGRRVEHFSNVLHIKSPVSYDGVTGVPIIEIAREQIANAITMEERAARLFGKSERPSGVVEVPKEVSVEAAKRLRDGWAAAHAGAHNGARTAFLYDGSTFRPLPFSSVDSEFVSIARETNYNIARAFGVPATLVNILDRATYSNAEQMNSQFYTLCLRPWLTEFKTAYERVLLTEEERDEYLVEFVTDDLLRADASTRAENYAKYRSMGVMTANEVRAGLNMPARDGGDELQNPYTTTAATVPAKEAA